MYVYKNKWQGGERERGVARRKVTVSSLAAAHSATAARRSSGPSEHLAATLVPQRLPQVALAAIFARRQCCRVMRALALSIGGSGRMQHSSTPGSSCCGGTFSKCQRRSSEPNSARHCAIAARAATMVPSLPSCYANDCLCAYR